jgi:hypothetical protein
MKVIFTSNKNKHCLRSIFIQLLLISLLLLFLAKPAKSQIDTLQPNIKDTIRILIDPEHALFGPSDPMHLTMRFDLNDFFRKRNDPQYIDAEVTLRFSNSDSVKHHVKIKASGVFRRSYCLFPPIHLNFKRSKFQAKEIGEQHTIKLVTHCKNSRSYTVYVLREYLAYRMYNILSPYSFQVRLLFINYVDKNNPKKHFTRYGFLVENPYSLAERTHTVLQKDAQFSRENISMEDATRVAVFEYMIGNTDFAAFGLHNLRLLEFPDSRRIFVPHDFDYTGFVGTDYAIPDASLGITDVKERLYLGKCVSDEMFEKTLKEFESYKNEFYKLIQEFDLLDKREKKETLSYIEEFFDLYKNKAALLNRLKSNCRDYLR